MAVVLSGVFVFLSARVLAVLTPEYDEGTFILGARFVGRGLRPFVDFAVHQPPLHLYLLALSGKVFGATLFGYRMLSVLSVAGTGFLVFWLVQAFMGPVPALVAQAVYLFSASQVHALGAVAEPPMLFFTVLGIVLLFLGSAAASAVAFVVAALVKPTAVVVAVAAGLSLVYARDARRLAVFVLAGLVAAIAALVWTFVLSGGIFADVLRFTAGRVGAGTGGMWAVDTGFADLRRILGIATPLQWRLFCMKIFYLFPRRYLPGALFVAGFLGVPFWVRACSRTRPALAAFAVLWPLSLLLLDFVVLDYVSAKYFVPFPAFTAFLVAGAVAELARRLPRSAALAATVLGAIALAWSFDATLGRQIDPWYYGRADWITREYPVVVSFSPLMFAANGTEPGCEFWNPPDTYGGFGQAVLGASERTRRLQFSDERLIDCLRARPEARLVVDFWFYFFTRPGSALRAYLHGTGKEQIVFFSPQSLAQWDAPAMVDADVAR